MSILLTNPSGTALLPLRTLRSSMTDDANIHPERSTRITPPQSDPIPGKMVPPITDIREPGLQEEQRIELSGPGETTYLELTWRAPAASEEDFFIVSVLDSLLTGPSSLNMFGGGGISNKTSRLYRALVEKEIAVSVNGSLQATMDPYLYGMTITIRPDSTPEKALQILDDETSRLMDSHVSQTDIDRAVKQARAMFVYGSENITNQAFWLGYSEMFDQYPWFLNYVDNLEKVTPEKIMQKAREYLSSKRRVVGIYHPEEKTR